MLARSWPGTLRLAAALLALWPLACAGREPRHGIRHVVLVSLDTVRADHLGCYGSTQARTPSLDAIARRGVRFDHCTAAAPTTLSSHLSLFTGTYPRTHGVPRNGFDVSPINLTLAEILKASGFHTAGFAGSFALDSSVGVAQGFDHWDEDFTLLFDNKTREQNERRASEVTDAALAHVDGLGPAPANLLLFAHYFDAHAPYDPPEGFRPPEPDASSAVTGSLDDLRAAVKAHHEQLGGPVLGLDAAIVGGLPAPWVGKAKGEPIGIDDALAARYRGEVAYVDAEVGRLLAGLEQRGILKDALVIVIADHGESFWEHEDAWNHGLAVYQTTVRIPWLVQLPDGAHAGRVVDGAVSNVDVLPTLLAWLDIDRPEHVEGVDLSAALAGATLAPRILVSNATQPGAKVEPPELAWRNELKPTAVVAGKHKYVRSQYQGREQLFDLARDPMERVDLLLAPTAEVERKRAELEAALERWNAARKPLPASYSRAFGAEMEQRLRELGYTEGAERDH